MAEWLERLTAMRDVFRSYLFRNTHVGERLAAMLTIKRSAGVTEDVNFREPISYMPLPSANKAAHSGLKTRGDVTRSKKQDYQWPPKKGHPCPPIFFSKNTFLFTAVKVR